MNVSSTGPRYFEEIPVAYLRPIKTEDDRIKHQAIQEKTNHVFEGMLQLLAEINVFSAGLQREISYSRTSDSSALHLITYLAKKIIPDCFRQKLDLSQKIIPIPKEEAEILETGIKQYEKAIIGLLLVAPPSIVLQILASLLGTPLENAITSGLSTIVLWLTAGVNTYVDAGNINVINDLKRLVVQGSSQEGAISEIKDTYKQLSSYLSSAWEKANDEEKEKLFILCDQIYDNWDLIKKTVKRFYMREKAVDEMFSPLAEVISHIFADPRMEELRQRLDKEKEEKADEDYVRDESTYEEAKALSKQAEDTADEKWVEIELS